MQSQRVSHGVNKRMKRSPSEVVQLTEDFKEFRLVFGGGSLFIVSFSSPLYIGVPRSCNTDNSRRIGVKTFVCSQNGP